MNRFLLPLGAFALLVIMFYIGVQNSPNRSTLTSVLVGRPAPEFTLPNMQNPDATVSTKDLRGKPWVLNVWGTWCAACRVEHQALMEISQQGQVPIIGLNWKDDLELAHEWLARLGNPYQVIAVDQDGRAAIDWGVYGAPETFLIDAQGVVQYRLAGAMTHEIWQREFLPRIQGKSAGTQ
jgi:cytochrome c biogenesis protein CcmG, thiol:disulfide interchange protein DsbE